MATGFPDFSNHARFRGVDQYQHTPSPDEIAQRRREMEADRGDNGDIDSGYGSDTGGSSCGSQHFGDGAIGDDGPTMSTDTDSSTRNAGPLSQWANGMGNHPDDATGTAAAGNSSAAESGYGDAGDIDGGQQGSGNTAAGTAEYQNNTPASTAEENNPVTKASTAATGSEDTPVAGTESPTATSADPAAKTGTTAAAATTDTKTAETPAAGDAAAGSNGVSKASQSGVSDAGKSIAVSGGGENQINLTNNGTQAQSYALFVNPGPGMTASFDRPDGFMTLQPGESASFNLPAGYGGYVQQMNDYTQQDYDNHVKPEADNFKATRAEYKFDTDGQLWFNNSNIDGYNASLKMSSGSESASVGGEGSVLDQIAKDHPELVKNVGGQNVIEGPQFFSDAINQLSVEEFNKYFGNTNTYVLPDDNLAMRHANSTTLDLEFGDA